MKHWDPLNRVALRDEARPSYREPSYSKHRHRNDKRKRHDLRYAMCCVVLITVVAVIGSALWMIFNKPLP